MKITADLIQAIRTNNFFKRNNTTYDGVTVKLHGNIIFTRTESFIKLSDGNYPSLTTKRRLYAIIEAYELPCKVRFHKGVIYFDYQDNTYTNSLQIDLPF
mgnify:CR=1 FL=1